MKTTGLLLSLLTSLLASTALAQSATSSASLNLPTAGDFMIRGRMIGILPDESSSVTPIGGKANFSNEVVPEVDFSYFFTDNISAELILAAAKHDAKVTGSVAGASVDVGSAWVVPPTLTLQYHLTSIEGIKPYVGAGVNYTMYLDEDPGSQKSLKLDNDFGYALQAGVDVPVTEHWAWNFDVKKLYVNSNGSWNGGAIKANIDLDPWVVGTGIAYRF